MVTQRSEIPIERIDRAAGIFFDAQGNRYFEISNAVFAAEGTIGEGTIAFHGTGSHGGHIVLKPLYVRQGERWVNMLTGSACLL